MNPAGLVAHGKGMLRGKVTEVRGNCCGNEEACLKVWGGERSGEGDGGPGRKGWMEH